jgi:5S rRNA maturation endonuclease (ribonuclease M5)
MGEKINNYNLKNEKIKIAHLPKGLYILSLFDNVGDKIQKKFIKN